MKVKLSRHAGFCFGVKRAINTALKANSVSGSVYTYGPIIHNPQVVKDFDVKVVFTEKWKQITSPDDVK